MLLGLGQGPCCLLALGSLVEGTTQQPCPAGAPRVLGLDPTSHHPEPRATAPWRHEPKLPRPGEGTEGDKMPHHTPQSPGTNSK